MAQNSPGKAQNIPGDNQPAPYSQGERGKGNAPLAAQMWVPFQKWAPLIRLPLLS